MSHPQNRSKIGIGKYTEWNVAQTVEDAKMLTPSWLRKIWKQSERRRQRSERRRRRDRITPYLSGAVLEERQVLNGVPILVAELAGAVELNSGTAADDGVADVYHARVVEHDGQDRLQITVNDQIAYSGPLGSAASITIRGSSDADVLVVYGSEEHPDAWQGLTFDAGGGDDRLILIDWSADSVQHTLTGDGAGQLSIANQDIESVLTYHGVESVIDSIDASIREFRFTSEGDRIDLSDDGWASNGISRLSGDGWPEVMFASPSERLQIDTTSSSVTRIDVRGLDASFDADLGLSAADGSLVRFERELALGSGDLRVQAGEIEVSGTVRTSQAVIELDAGTRVHLESGSSLQNDGGRVTLLGGEIQHDGLLTARGGEVTMQARGGALIVSGTVDVSDSTEGNSGGTIQLLGDRVGLLDAARIDASGSAGGGRVLIGGDYQGANPDLGNALRTYVGAEVRIAADAIDAGDGGTVIVWADEATWFYGRITARGGEQEGHGGFAEVSGVRFLDYRGQVDTRAPLGSIGTLLLDPTNVRIVAAGAETNDLADVDAFGDPDIPPDNDVKLDVAAINAATSNVVIQANNDIIVEAAIVIADPGASLTMQAGRSIIINANITTNDGAVTLTANETVANGVQDADRDEGAAVVSMAAGTTINAGNQDITIRVSTGPDTNDTSGDITLDNLTTTGHVLVVNDGPTVGSGMVRESASSLITANSVALDVHGAGGGGEIGESVSPIRVDAANIAARGQSAGVFIEIQSDTVVGGAALGGLTGTFSSDGPVELSATLGTAITVSEAVSSGSGNITLTADEIAVNSTISGSGVLVLQPTTTTRSIGINDVGDYRLDTTEIANLQEGFSSIRIGRTDGEHTITVGSTSFADAIVLSAPQPGGSITVNGQLDTLASADAASVTLDGSGATTTLNADIVTAGGDVTINDSVLVGGARTINTHNGGAAAGKITIDGAIGAVTGPGDTLSLDADATVTDGDVELKGNVAGPNELAGLTVRGAQIDVQDILVTGGNLSVTGSNIDLNGTSYQTTTSGTITFTGPIDLNADVTVSGAGGAADSVELDGAINSEGGARSLEVQSGAASASLGALGVSSSLSSLTVNHPSGIGTIALAGIGGGTAGVAGDTTIGNANTGGVTFSGTTYHANQQTYTAAGGNNLRLTASSATAFTGSDDAISFNTAAVEIGASTSLNVTSAGGAIAAQAGIRAAGGATDRMVNLNASGGSTNTIHVGAIGSGNEILSVTLNGPGGVTLGGDIVTSNTAAGNQVVVTGSTTITGDRSVSTAAGGGAISLGAVTGNTPGNGLDLTLDAGTGSVTVGTIGTAAAADAINAVTVTGSGVTLQGSIFTGEDVGGNGGHVSIHGAVTLAANVTVDTSDAGGGGAGTIAFQDAVNSDGTARSLALNAPARSVTFSGGVGGAAALQSVTIHNAHDATFSGTVQTSGDFTQTAGTGTTTLNGTSGTGIGGMLSLTTDAIAFNTATVVTVGAVDLQAQNAVTLNAGLNAGSSTIAIAANQDGSGAEGFSQTTGTIQTTNATANAVAINVNAAGGGTGSAALGNISTGSGGTITVSTATGGNTSGGSITQAALTLLNVGSGTVALSTPTAGSSGIGTAAANIRTTAGTVTATAGSSGVFITETDGASFTATATGSGDVRLTNIAGTLNVAGATTTGNGAIVLSSGDAITLNAAVGGGGFSGTVTIDANTDNTDATRASCRTAAARSRPPMTRPAPSVLRWAERAVPRCARSPSARPAAGSR
jgi:trimeric autotransporter adhesin